MPPRRRLPSRALVRLGCIALAVCATAPRSGAAQCDPAPRPRDPLAKAIGDLRAPRRAPAKPATKPAATPARRPHAVAAPLVRTVSNVAAPRAEPTAAPAAKPAAAKPKARKPVARKPVRPDSTVRACRIDTTRLPLAPEVTPPLDQMESPFGLEPLGDLASVPANGALPAGRAASTLPGLGTAGSSVGSTPGISSGILIGAAIAAIGSGGVAWRAIHTSREPGLGNIAAGAHPRGIPIVDLPTAPTSNSPDLPAPGGGGSTGSGTDAPQNGGGDGPTPPGEPTTPGTGTDSAGGGTPPSTPPVTPPGDGPPPTIPGSPNDFPVFPPGPADGPRPGDPLFPGWVPGLPQDGVPTEPRGDGEEPHGPAGPHDTPQSPVPEPATAMLLFAGVAALAGVVARRR